jgi:3-hydroxyacyl-CoA dehydrogenase/enoyl-CoA hydratase/3-hydroxybutyryl-CoA epimerase
MGEDIILETLSYRRAENGVVFITIDVKDRPVNVLTPELHRAIGQVAAMLAQDEQAIGAVIHSGKPSFMAGGDLNRIVRYYDMQRTPEQAYTESRTYTESLRQLETCGKPVAVAINGTALGGGLELALACHYRVVADDEHLFLGLPEVSLGLLPGGGGTQRLPRIVGIRQAADLIISGKRIGPKDALKIGLVNEVVPTAELIARAEHWVLQRPDCRQPWDQPGFRMPGGATLNDMNIGRLFQQLTASVSAEYRHNYPAPVAALRCLFNGTTVLSMDAALKIETREFSALTRDPVARNMIRTLFINKGKLSRAEILSGVGAEALQKKCLEAYIGQGRLMQAQGVKPAVIENSAYAAGMPQGPLALSGETAAENAQPGEHTEDVAMLGERFLCAQALAAAECWEQGAIDPVQADLVSVLGWGFPSYTGGVMSYIDTQGLGAFIALCDTLRARYGAQLTPSAWLREQQTAGDRIYPRTA